MEETARPDTPEAAAEPTPAAPAALPKAPEGEVFQGVQAAVAAVLVGVAALLVHFSAVHVPFNGPGDDLLCDTPKAHALLTAPEAFPLLPDAPLTVMGLAAAWQAGGGGAGTVRALGLFAHVLAALGVFLLARRGRRPGSGEGIALGTALLFALSPAAARALSTAPGLAPVLGAALAVWAMVCLDRLFSGKSRFAALAVVLGAAACAADATAALFLVAALAASLPALRHRAEQLGFGALLAILCAATGAAARLAAGMPLPEALGHAAGITGADPALAAYYAWAVAALALAAVIHRMPPGTPRIVLAGAAGAGAVILGVFSFLDLAARQNADAALLAATEAAPDSPGAWASLARYCERQTASGSLADDARAEWRGRAREAWVRAAEAAPGTAEYRWKAVRAGVPEISPDPAEIAALLLRAPRADWAADAAALAASLRPADAADTPGAARAALDGMAYAARRAPNRADLQGARGLQLFMAGNMREAAPLLAAATAALPGAPFAFAAEPAQKAAERVAALEKASREKLTANPGDPAGHLARVEYELASGRLTQALHLAASTHRRFPGNADATRLLGMARALRGEADRFLDEAGDTLAPDAWDALTRQAASANAWAAALRYAAKAPRPGGESPEEKLAETALALRRPDQAERLLRAALDADPANWKPALRLADMARDAQQPDAAAAWLAEAQKRGAPESEFQQRGGAPAPQTFEPVRTMIQ